MKIIYNTMKKMLTLLLLTVTYIHSQTVSDGFTSAMEYYHQKIYSEAQKLFDEVIEEYGIEDEFYAAAHYYSAESLLNMGKNEEAANRYEFIVNNVIWSDFREEALYKLGMIYYDAGRYSRSRLKLITLLNDYPAGEYTGTALYWIGESYAEEGKLNEAIDFLTQAIEDKRSNSYRDYSIFALAGVYEKTGDYENAVKYYDQLLTTYPNSPLAVQSQMRIGVCYFHLKDYQTSILELSNPSLSGLPGESLAEGLYLLANSHYRVEEYDDAVNTYSEILEKFPNSQIYRNAQYGLAWSYFQQKKYNDAYNVFNFLSEGEDSIAMKSFIWKGESKRYAGNYSEAQKIFEDFLKKYPDSELATLVEYQVGVINFEQYKYDLATKFLTNATSSDDDITRAKSFTLIGEIELEKKNYIKAKGHFEPAVRITNADADVHQRALMGLGIASYYLEEYEPAIEYLKQSEQINPSFEPTKISYYLAESYFSSGKFQEALSRYNSIQTEDEEISKQVLYSKGYCYFNLGNYDNASYHFNDFLKIYPDDKKANDVKFRLADSYYGSKNYAAASRVLKELFTSKTVASDDPYSHYQYAQALYKSGETEEAIREFENIQQRFPNTDYAENSLFTVGWIRFQQDKYAEAISNYKRVLVTYGNTSLVPIIYYSIGDAYFNLEKYDSAIVNYQKVISSYPSSDYVFDAINGIQYCYVAMGRHERAIQLIDEFINRNPNLKFSDQVYFKKGEIYYSQRDYQNAKISYQEFITRYPKSSFIPEAYYWLGKSSQNLKENDEAIFYFQKVFDNYPNSESAAVSVIDLGTIYDVTGNSQAAVDLYNKVGNKLKDSPRFPEILFMKGMAFVKLNNVQQAYQTFEELSLYHKENLFADKAKFEMGLIDLAAGRYDRANELFLAVSEKRTDDVGAKAQYHYGLSLYEQQKYSEAISALVRVRTVYSLYDEWLSRSYLLMGDCYVKLDDKHKAEEMYRSVLAKHKTDSLGVEAREKINLIEE